jgi:hypothetical protein
VTPPCVHCDKIAAVMKDAHASDRIHQSNAQEMTRPLLVGLHLASATVVALILIVRASGVTSGQEEPRYPGIGPGHYITAVREDGRFITLEDKSQWEIAEMDRHKTIAWQEMEGISIRYAGGTDAFRYEIDDIERDEGASARWVRPQK